MMNRNAIVFYFQLESQARIWDSRCRGGLRGRASFNVSIHMIKQRTVFCLNTQTQFPSAYCAWVRNLRYIPHYQSRSFLIGKCVSSNSQTSM